MDLKLDVAHHTGEVDADRRRAFVVEWFENSNLTKCAAVAGVSYNTALKWKGQAWFDKALKDLKRARDRQMDGRITKIIEKALDRLEDRIEEGDTKVFSSKDGIETRKVPVSARDLAVVTGVLFDKRATIRKEPDSDDTASSALDRIADKLREYARTEKIAALTDAGTVDVEATEVQDNEDLV